MYVPDQYKTQEMCDKVKPEIGGMLRFIPDCYKNKKTCDKAVENYFHELEFVSDCYKIPKMCNKSYDTYPSAIQFVPECYKNKYKAVDTCPFVFNSVLDQYETQEIRDKAVDASLTALNCS